MNKVEKIFEMIGLKPNEEFTIKNLDGKYRLTGCLVLQWYDNINNSGWHNMPNGLANILTEAYKIDEVVRPERSFIGEVYLDEDHTTLMLRASDNNYGYGGVVSIINKLLDTYSNNGDRYQISIKKLL